LPSQRTRANAAVVRTLLPEQPAAEQKTTTTTKKRRKQPPNDPPPRAKRARVTLAAGERTGVIYDEQDGRYAVRLDSSESNTPNQHTVWVDCDDLLRLEAVSGLTSQLSALALDTVRGNVLSDVDLVENILELCMPDSRKTWGRHHFVNSMAELMDKPLSFQSSAPNGPLVFQGDHQRTNAVYRRDLRGKACTFVDGAGDEKPWGGREGFYSNESIFNLIIVRVTDTGQLVIVPRAYVEFVEHQYVSLHSAAIQEVKDAIPTLLASRGVCRLWRAATCRPLLAAVLSRDITIMVSMYFDLYTTARSLKGGSLPKIPELGRLSSADEKTFQWLATGFENGTNSLLTVDHGIDHIRSAVALMQFLSIKKVTGNALVLAPRAACTAWAQALATTKLECFHAVTSQDDIDYMKDMLTVGTRILHGFGVVLLSYETYETYESGLSLHETLWKLAVIDVVGLPTAEALDKIKLTSNLQLEDTQAAGETIPTAAVTLTSESLPTDLDALWTMMGASGIDRRFPRARVPRLKKRAAAAISKFGRLGDDAIGRWAVESFLVPRLHSALHKSFHMHRKASDDAEP